jgi:hypothetical protein
MMALIESITASGRALYVGQSHPSVILKITNLVDLYQSAMDWSKQDQNSCCQGLLSMITFCGSSEKENMRCKS